MDTPTALFNLGLMTAIYPEFRDHFDSCGAVVRIFWDN